MIVISQKALSYLKRKQQKAKATSCRIFLVAQHCHGAQFAYRFDEENENDEKIIEGDMPFLIDKTLLELYEGFVIDLESSFLMDKLKISPQKERHKCSCHK
jgi:Fe-S cluster assembly iron-binding protein IscA